MSVLVRDYLFPFLPQTLAHTSTDIATISVNQAQDQWNSLKGDCFNAWFSQFAAYPIKTAVSLLPEALSLVVDVVTMQFWMHYAFETEADVYQMLDNIARYLCKGGRFIGTIPNAASAEFLMYVCPIPRTPTSPSLLFLLSCAVLMNTVTDRAKLRKIRYQNARD